MNINTLAKRMKYQCRRGTMVFIIPYWQEEREAIAQQICHQKNTAPATDPSR